MFAYAGVMCALERLSDDITFESLLRYEICPSETRRRLVVRCFESEFPILLKPAFRQVNHYIFLRFGYTCRPDIALRTSTPCSPSCLH